MLGRVEALPLEPEVMLQARSVEGPGQASFVRTDERKRFPLQGWKQSVGTAAIGPTGMLLVAAGNVPSTNDERRPRTVSDSTGLVCSNASSDPKRWLANPPAEIVTRSFTAISAVTRTAAPNIVSPSRNGFLNSVLSP